MYFITLQFQHVNSLSRPFYGQPGKLVPILDDGQGKDQFNWANSRLFGFAKRVMEGFTWDELLEPLVHVYLILFYFILDLFWMFSYCCSVCANLSLPQAIIWYVKCSIYISQCLCITFIFPCALLSLSVRHLSLPLGSCYKLNGFPEQLIANFFYWIKNNFISVRFVVRSHVALTL